MDKSVIVKILFGVALLTTQTYVFAENIPSQEEKKSAEEEEGDLEPMKELPELQQICPDLDRALDTSMGKFKPEKVKIVDPVFKSLNIGIEMASLGKDAWFAIARRKSQNKDYNFDYHGRLGTVWKYNIYLGGDFGYSTGRDCIWESKNDNAGQNAKEEKKLESLNKKYEHLFKGPYMNVLLGYDYHFNDNNSLIIAGKFACAWTTITKLARGYNKKVVRSLTSCWLGVLLAAESKIFSSPVYWGCDVQANWLLNKKRIRNVKNYFIPDYGHSDYRVNFGFNLFLGIKLDFGEKIITP